MRIKITFIFLYLISLVAFSQNKSGYVDTEIRMMQIPKSSVANIDDIATYVKSNFSTDNEKVRAVFYWITQTINYDVPAMNSNKLYDNEDQIIVEVLKTKKGVCGHYATLFSRICNGAGIKTVIVYGITKQNGKIDKASHAWNVCFLDGKWQIIDPTWGSGETINGNYVRKLNDVYFLQSPEKSILERFPFDPIWQLLNNPYSFDDFVIGKYSADKSKSPVNFNDSISAYEKQTEFERKCALIQRIESYNPINSLILKFLNHQKSDISVFQYNHSVEMYNNATASLTIAINDINDFIAYRNKQFIPKRSDTAMKLMLESVEALLIRYKTDIDKIKYTEPSLRNLISEANNSYQSALNAYTEQKAFLDKYLSTAKFFRKSLLYNYYWMGIPLNQKK
jgi:hypothetical protein